ncbi:hypothetical protein B566_EDAN009804 [Ephemera danica]|nr:hypothetical protein B566_EDAN009804 [Ephemera danica]
MFQNRRSSGGESSSSSAGSSPPAVSGCQRALENALRGPGPYPSVLLPPGGGYWQEEPSTHTPSVPELEIDDTATAYRTHFMGKEHCNLVCEEAGLMSVLTEDGSDVIRILLRLRNGTTHHFLASPELQLGDEARFTPVLCPRAAELIAAYDEHAVARTFKFGVLQQRRGQTTEEQIFSNRAPSPALLHFLSHLGNTVKLAHHKGYRGGLDTQFGQTGEESVFSVFRERELMFHVAPMLPYTENDPQQLQRKRHIGHFTIDGDEVNFKYLEFSTGNDIVALVFQEENTPFAPDMIASHFLHVFLVVQPVSPPPHVRYRVTVAAREGVPSFGPPLPPSSEFAAGPELREWLLTKLVNAEAAACKARKFASLEERTRASLLVSLTEELRSRTSRFLGDSSSAPASPEQRQQQHGAGSRFISTVRKAISARARAPQPPQSQQLQTQTSKNLVTAVPESPASPTRPHCEVSRRSSADSGNSERPSQTSNDSGASSPDFPPAYRVVRRRPIPIRDSCHLESDASSVGSGTEEAERSQRLHLHYAGDSDTGLESMSSADTARCCSLEPSAPATQCSTGITAAEAEALTQEVARLKCDKLDLLRHNVICQRDVKILTEETLQLRAELSAASSELRRLRALLRECAFSSDASDV